MGRSYLDGQVDATPAFVWMTTDGNDRRAQLEAGRAWVRLNLKATELGLGVAPLSQVIQEYAEMAALQRDFRAEIGTPAGRRSRCSRGSATPIRRTRRRAGRLTRS